MLSSTSKYILLTCFLFASTGLSAANKKKDNAKKYPLYQGTTLGVELLRPISGILSNQSGYSGKLDVNFRNTYFPTLEVGNSKLNKTAENGMNCESSGSFIKIGLNKSMAFLGDKAENMFFVGAHYGFSSYTYNVTQLQWHDQYWGNNSTTSFLNQSGNAGWLELAVGVRVAIMKPFSLGWTFQYKSSLHESNNPNGLPLLIPGYGEFLKPQLGLALHMYYRLPF